MTVTLTRPLTGDQWDFDNEADARAAINQHIPPDEPWIIGVAGDKLGDHQVLATGIAPA